MQRFNLTRPEKNLGNLLKLRMDFKETWRQGDPSVCRGGGYMFLTLLIICWENNGHLKYCAENPTLAPLSSNKACA